jgi:threonine dehydrogenase-like Zn-dependent dehydrogenase
VSKIALLYAPRDLRFEEHRLPALGPDDVLLRTRLGAVSAGTESAWYFGTDPQLDADYRAVRFDRPTFPRTLGYEKVAEVTAVGPAVTSLIVGQRVTAYYGHAEEFVLPAARVVPVPVDVSDEQAVFSTLMTVAAHAVRRSRLAVGDDVVITGQGVVGLLTLIAARLAGANRIVVSDRATARLSFARQFGADLAWNGGEGSFVDAVRGKFGPSGFDVAFECSSSYEALADAMALLKRNGRMTVVSQLKGRLPAHPVFGVEFHLGELEMISTDGGGDRLRLTEWFFGALRRGAIKSIESLATDRVRFTELPRAFELIEREPERVIKVLVTYDRPSGSR